MHVALEKHDEDIIKMKVAHVSMEAEYALSFLDVSMLEKLSDSQHEISFCSVSTHAFQEAPYKKVT